MVEKEIVVTAPWLYEKENGEVRLIGNRCKVCEQQMFPAQEQCSKCLSKELEKFALPTDGILYSYSSVIAAPAGFEGPYSLGYADLGEFRIFGNIKNEHPQIGDKVKIVEDVLRETEDKICVGYKFEVVKEEK